jgi:hypothetical protein
VVSSGDFRVNLNRPQWQFPAYDWRAEDSSIVG